jgi:hypothetical protein
VAVWDIMEGQYSGFDSAKEFFAHVREDFEKLNFFPVPDEVAPLNGDECDDFKAWIRSFGWPPAREDGATWRREECMKQIDDRVDELR